MNEYAFEKGKPVPSIDFDYDAIDAYDFSNSDTDSLLESFNKVFDWIADVSANDFKGMAIRVQTVRCILLQKDQTKMAKEIGVTKAAISQRMCDLRDFFNIRNPKAGLRDDETRQKFSEQCKQRHQRKKRLSNSANSPATSTTNSETATSSPLTPSAAELPLSKRLFALANS